MDKIGLMPHDIRLMPGNATAVRHGHRLQKPVKRPLPVSGEGLYAAQDSWRPCRKTLYIVDYLSAGQDVAGIEGVIIFGTPAMARQDHLPPVAAPPACPRWPS